MKKGFTLIELLVVVLIIAILSAIALPQYRKAVFKARMVSVLPMLRAIKESQERYYLANGTYTARFDNLDLGLEANYTSSKTWPIGGGHAEIRLNPVAYYRTLVGGYGERGAGCFWKIYMDQSRTRKGELWCVQQNPNNPHPWCQQICEGMGVPYSLN